MSEPLTLADVVSRGTPVDWFEAVAIAQALCAALGDDSGSAPSAVPEFDRIQITPEGSVSLAGLVAQGQPPVQGVGRTLLGLVPEHRMPVQLRLLGLTAISPTPSYSSVLELSSALDYFARPDRAAQVRAVYERCAALPRPAAGLESEATRLAPETASAQPSLKPPPPAPRRRPAPAVALTALALLLAAGASAAWLLAGRPAPAAGETVMRTVSEAAQTATAAAADTVQAVGRQLGLAGGTLPALSPEARITDVILPAGAGRSSPPAREPAAMRLTAIVPSMGWGAIAPVFRVDETVFAAANDEGPDPLEGPAGLEPDYYALADVDVTPPTLLRPRLPRLPPSGVRLAELPHVDLLVTETGEVEWVRLWPADVGVHSAMMLSAIKNWRFEPARRDGRPVRYRQTITLTSQ